MYRQKLNKCHMDLIKSLKKEGVITSPRVQQILCSIDRKYFVPKQPFYNDSPSYIGYGATISAPHMHAYALEYLQKQLISAKNVLDVGSGTGILTLAMAMMVPEGGTVFGIQHVHDLVQKSMKNIWECKGKEYQEKIRIVPGDGRLGWPDKEVKFDVIHVGAAPPEIPQALIDQLAEGGVMVIPVGPENETQKFMRVQKHNGQISQKNLHYVSYVPLTDLSHQITPNN